MLRLRTVNTPSQGKGNIKPALWAIPLPIIESSTILAWLPRWFMWLLLAFTGQSLILTVSLERFYPICA